MEALHTNTLGSHFASVTIRLEQKPKLAKTQSLTNDTPISATTKLLNRAKNFMASIADNVSAFGSAALRGIAAFAVLIGGGIASLATCCLPPSLMGGIDIRQETWDKAKALWKKPKPSTLVLTSDL